MILELVKLVNILSMIVAELFEILMGRVIHGRKLLESKIFMKSNAGVCIINVLFMSIPK